MRRRNVKVFREDRARSEQGQAETSRNANDDDTVTAAGN